MLCFGGVHAKVALVLLLLATVLQAVALLTHYWLRLHGHEVPGGFTDNLSEDGIHYYGLFRYCWHSDNNTETGKFCVVYPKMPYKWWWPAAGLEAFGMVFIVLSSSLAALKIVMAKFQKPCVRKVPGFSASFAAAVVLIGCIVYGTGHHDMKFVGDIHIFVSFYLAVLAAVFCVIAAILLFLAPGATPRRATPVVQYTAADPTLSVVSDSRQAVPPSSTAHSGAHAPHSHRSHRSNGSTQMTQLSTKPSQPGGNKGYFNSAMF